MTISYALSAAAETDLRGIIRYTRQQWGDDQVRAYIAKLTRCIENAVSGQRSTKDMNDIHAGLRMSRCEHHYVFYLLRENQPALIVAIFHERMDLMTRLTERLR